MGRYKWIPWNHIYLKSVDGKVGDGCHVLIEYDNAAGIANICTKYISDKY